MKVLVVDDDKGSRMVLEKLLTGMGHEAVLAEDGEAGLSIFRQQPFDVIISDLIMPKMDGFQLLEKVHGIYRNIPFIILTANDSFETVQKAMHLGAYDFMARPIDKSVVSACLFRIKQHLDMEKKLEEEKLWRLMAKAGIEADKEVRQKLNKLNMELSDNVRLLQTLIDTVPTPLFQKDAYGRFQRCNRAFSEQIAGKRIEDIIGRCEQDIFPDRPLCTLDFESLRKTGEVACAQSNQTHSYICADGIKREFAPRCCAFRDSEGNIAGVVGTMVDVTAIKVYEQQLRQSEKMQAIGQLAAGVAHEINNPTGFIMSNLGTLAEYVTAFKKIKEREDNLRKAVKSGKIGDIQARCEELEGIQKDEDLDFIIGDIDSLLEESLDGTRRIRDIVQSLKSFSRSNDDETAGADINEGIETTLKIVWNELKYKCEVTKDLKPLPKTVCNMGQLNQVFMNLLVNAAHAIEKNGEIRIATSAADDEIVIAISDTGSGIEPEFLGKIFDPFFTTKEIGKGTGLGLSISHGIVTDHGGKIEVESEVGKGTTFTVRLPVQYPS